MRLGVASSATHYKVGLIVTDAKHTVAPKATPYE